MSPLAGGALVFVSGGGLGLAGGLAVGIFVYPYLFLADIVATEKVDSQVARKVLARGEFIHANPSDPIHYGKGRVTVYEGVLHLEHNLKHGVKIKECLRSGRRSS